MKAHVAAIVYKYIPSKYSLNEDVQVIEAILEDFRIVNQ